MNHSQPTLASNGGVRGFINSPSDVCHAKHVCKTYTVLFVDTSFVLLVLEDITCAALGRMQFSLLKMNSVMRN